MSGTYNVTVTGRNPLSLDMGWKDWNRTVRNPRTSRNPLSLDMGWKDVLWHYSGHLLTRSQSAFAGYGLESPLYRTRRLRTVSRNPLSLDMGWKRYLPSAKKPCRCSRNPLALDMGWKRAARKRTTRQCLSRNPLALDMGWKSRMVIGGESKTNMSQSACAGYGMEESVSFSLLFRIAWSQSAFAGYGMEERKAEKLATTSEESQSAFAGYGMEELIQANQLSAQVDVAIRFRWIWDGRGGTRCCSSAQSQVAIRFRWIWDGRVQLLGIADIRQTGRNPLSLDMGWKSGKTS